MTGEHAPRIGTTVEHLKRVASTMDAARDLDEDGAVVVAGEQTGGRGRHDRSWTSPPGGLYVSALLWPDAPVDRFGLIPLWTGLAVRDALADLGVEAELSWPNDVLVDGEKVGGVLVETELGERPRVVAGVGVNVTNDPPEQTRRPATRVADHAEATVDELLDALLDAWSRRYAAFETAPGACLDDLREACATLERTVTVATGDGELTGRALRVADDGALVVATDDGERTIRAGDVEEVRP